MILTKKQEDALRIIKQRYGTRERYTCIAGYAGSGKALAASTRIPVYPTGTKPLSQIKIGDIIYTEKGKCTRVEGVFPQGLTNCYKVEFEDGRISKCNRSHIWRVRERGHLRWKDLTLEEIMNKGIKTRNGKPRFSIPVCAPVVEHDVGGPLTVEYALYYMYSLGLVAKPCGPEGKIEYKKQKTLAITNITKIEEEETICLYVDNTTLTKYIPEALGLNEQDICHIAYTGKAANVLTQKGHPNAMTAHKLLYNPVLNKKTGTYMFVPKKTIEDYKLIIIDEISMLPSQMWILLLSHNIPVIAIGDPAQLPPVSEEMNNGVLDKPHVFLDEIMRQAQESEVIRLSMYIREGGDINQYKPEGQQVKFFHNDELTVGTLKWADQILCATNQTRQGINAKMREIYGYNPKMPEIGDKVIALTNRWEFLSNRQNALTNGTIGTLTSYTQHDIPLPKWTKKNKATILDSNIDVGNGEKFTHVPIDYNMIVNNHPTLTLVQESKLKRVANAVIPFDFTYAYAITTWKAQGSEWDKVVGFVESFPREEEERRRYLYTLITRAKEKLVMIL